MKNNLFSKKPIKRPTVSINSKFYNVTCGMSGLLRQYFPKSMELLDVTVQKVLSAVDKLNNRPRKCLNFKTPYEVFEKLTGVDVRKIMGYALIT